tara:strand:+ start:287 stop:601 length:315 start_codon:yes stop_codon:yes gene_type:complete
MIPIPLEEPTTNCCNAKFIEESSKCSDCKENAVYIDDEEDELIHKAMRSINTFQAHENEIYLRGKDEYGNDFQVVFDSYDFLNWIDTEHLAYIKQKLIEYIELK